MTRCTDCRALIPSGSRCAACDSSRNRRRSAQRGGQAAWIATTRAVRERDGGCVLPGPHEGPLRVDHIRPLAAGGGNEDSNLRAICLRHHREITPGGGG